MEAAVDSLPVVLLLLAASLTLQSESKSTSDLGCLF